MTTSEDIGKLVTEIFFSESAIENSIVYIGGDTLTYGQLADIAESLWGQKFERTISTIKELQNDLKSDPTNFVKKYHLILGAGRGVSWELDKTLIFKMALKQSLQSSGQKIIFISYPYLNHNGKHHG